MVNFYDDAGRFKNKECTNCGEPAKLECEECGKFFCSEDCGISQSHISTCSGFLPLGD